jgi:2-oxoisovalerate dehydrogenase E2 component (dihydrolipoyl transacylase)
VRRLAQENNIDVNTIQGTGVGGRITRDDVMTSISVPQTTSAVNPSNLVNNEDTILKITPIRKMIAEAMVRSVSQIPHAWSTIETDVSSLVDVRSSHRQNFIEKEAVELTYLPFIIKMVVESLRENPTLNATWGGDNIILKNRINIGVAMAGPEGLIVPVIKDADKLSIVGLAHELSDLTFKVKSRKLNVEDVQDGTFTVNNTGVLGSISSQPIINYPQAAILTTEAIQKKPIVIGDGIAIRSIMNLCMSFDHRINDGAESSSFLQSIKRRIESINLDTPVY